jgi:siderophore synthetase component
MSTPGAIEPERVAEPAAGRRLPSLLYLDRYRNEGTRDYSPHAAYSEAREEYRPDTGEAVFHLPVYELPRGEMQVHAANPPPELEAAYLPEDAVLFCIHPQVLSQCPDDPYVQRTHRLSTARSQVHASRQHLRVSPTSSTRTLLVAQEVGPTHFCPHSLKVHFPFRISRYGRRMRDEVVEQAIAVSEELERWLEVERRREIERLPGIEESGKPGFAFLREVIGITHRNLSPDSARGENWGYLVRDMVPFPVVDEARDLVPGFALYGRDLFDPQLSPLILELADPGDAAGWTLENVLLPIVRHWVRCFQDLGFVLEPHGQNVLLEIDQNGRARPRSSRRRSQRIQPDGERCVQQHCV